MLFKYIPLLGMLILSLMSGSPALALETEAPEQSIKAAYLFHFALYTEWPNPPTDSIGICIAGRDPFGNVLDVLAEKRLRGKPVTIRRLDNRTDFSGCHILYIGNVSSAQETRIAHALQKQAILTVAEVDNPDNLRPMILLVPDGNRIAFEVNLSKSKAAGIVLSSRLLRLARVLH